MKQKNFLAVFKGFKGVNKILIIKAMILILELAAVGVAIYSVVLPFYPTIKYKIIYEKTGKRIYPVILIHFLFDLFSVVF